MRITDKDGKEMEVTDINKAIEMVENFVDLEHDPCTQTDRDRQEYWQDIHQKLLSLKEQLSSKDDQDNKRR